MFSGTATQTMSFKHYIFGVLLKFQDTQVIDTCHGEVLSAYKEKHDMEAL